jgi:phage major head subunit gpT-like protein
MSPEISETMAFLGQYPVRCTIVVDNKCLEQVRNFKYCGCKSSYENDKAIQQKLAKFPQILGILNIQPTLVQKFSRIKVYNAIAIPILLYGSEILILR